VDILDIIGNEHRKWLVSLWSQHKINQEPLQTLGGEIIAEPLFWFKADDKAFACFGRNEPRQRIVQQLEDFGVKLLQLGEAVPNTTSK
jgi:hypothetical protein